MLQADTYNCLGILLTGKLIFTHCDKNRDKGTFVFLSAGLLLHIPKIFFKKLCTNELSFSFQHSSYSPFLLKSIPVNTVLTKKCPEMGRWRKLVLFVKYQRENFCFKRPIIRLS